MNSRTKRGQTREPTAAELDAVEAEQRKRLPKWWGRAVQQLRVKAPPPRQPKVYMLVRA